MIGKNSGNGTQKKGIIFILLKYLMKKNKTMDQS